MSLSFIRYPKISFANLVFRRLSQTLPTILLCVCSENKVSHDNCTVTQNGLCEWHNDVYDMILGI